MRCAARAIKAMDGVKDPDNRFHLVFGHIAEMLEANGEFEDAIRFRQEAHSSIESARGKQSPEIVQSLINLARALNRAGRFEEASSVYETASKAYTPKTTAEGVKTGAATMEMATMLTKCGKHAEAEENYQEAISIFTQAEGNDGINVSIAWTNLAVLYAEMERYEEAMKAFEKSLCIRRQRFSERNANVAWVENNQADCLRRMRRFVEAEAQAKSAIEGLRAEKHFRLPNALDTLGWTYLDSERYSEAETAFAEACGLLQAQPDHDPQALCRFANRRAQALSNLGRDAEAEQIKADALRDAGTSHRQLASILQEQPDALPKVSPKPSSRVEDLQSDGPSLANRAILAVCLTVGFYALAFAGAAACGWSAWRMFAAHAYRIAFSFAVPTVAILIAIFPRRDRFEAPGPQLFQNDQPDLFAVIEGIARAAGETMPAAVYLIPESNAYVAERGGFLGFGARRIMGLGLPLLQTLTVQQLRSVIAHEFGHYASGDTRFSSWIYTTRAAVIRSVTTLRAVNSSVHLLFEWYAQLFLRLTLRVARRQEYAADALAARITSAEVVSSALRATHSNLYTAFWSRELEPVLRCGFLPPISTGFEVFRREQTDDELQIQDEPSGPYDTHPPLALRLQALLNLPATVPLESDTRTSVSLLNDLAEIERQVVETPSGPPQGGWKPVEWHDCGANVFIPFWETEIAKFADVFAFVRFKDLPSIIPDRAAARVGSEYNTSAAANRIYAQVLVGRAAGLALLRDGWIGTGAPGDPVWFSKGPRRMNPSALVKDLWAAKLKDSDWSATASEAGVSDLPLAC
jgi:heat shock protein HtpX